MEAKTWEDTVMSEEKIINLVTDFHFSGEAKNRHILVRKAVEHQAEITGKIMYDEGFKAGHDKGRTVCPTNEVQGTIYLEGKQASIKEVVELALQAINDEPEFSGDMPDELWDKIGGDREITQRVMQNTVRLTKEGIKERLEAKLKEWGI